MSVDISVYSDNFSFNLDKEKDILKAIKEGIKDKTISNSRWVSLEYISKCNNLVEVFEEFGFDLFINKDNKFTIEFFREKLDEFEEELFKCIAPYVNDGYLEYRDIGEGDVWRYVFKNGECKTIFPKIVWDM